MNRKTVLVLFMLLGLLSGCVKEKEAAQRLQTMKPAVIEETQAEATTTEKQQTTEENDKNEDKTKVSEFYDIENFESDVYIVGDSIALGYGAYQRVPSSHVYAQLNLAPSTVRDYTFEYDSKEHTALAILSREKPDMIMLSMGVNDIAVYSSEKFAEEYVSFLSDVQAVCPKAKIYVMGLTPVMESCDYTNNESILEYNEALKKAIDEHKSDRVRFVSAADELYDAKGCLKEEYSSGDGMHLSGAAYDVQLENIKDVISG